ncbi:MAG: glycosyltransferase family 2 protein [Sulfobacillus benefaciens]|uniref:Glycosyltransferase family 2 protein n=1 Tax=Sulfobacillus benefaciens TaxID=453960 RepID=A0A2T2WUF8_9FIRM|nr:MAG: glycosyltransferase family 2 protein [Sulfobacillus benefaciens]
MNAACTVVLVSYNSQRDLARCLPSIMASPVPKQIIVVDNHSDDDTVSWLKNQFPLVEVYANSANLGYGAACNQGLEHAQGEYWCIANPDTVWDTDVLARLRETAERFPEALINPAIIQPNGLVNAYGNTMHVTGITTCVDLGETWSDQGERYRFPLSASGAVIFAKASVWRELRGFDPDYFLYFEDTNLSLRAFLRNIPVVCDTRARVVHHYDLKMSPNKFYWLERNRLLTLFEILEARTLRRLWPGLLLTEAATWAFAILHGPRFILARFKGYIWLWRHRKSWLRKREIIQATRQVPDGPLLQRMTYELPLGQLTGNVRWAQIGNRWLTKIYQALRVREAHVCE